MAFPLKTSSPVSRALLIYFLVMLLYGAKASNENKVTNIGVIIVDITSRIGKEEIIGAEIAAQKYFNGSSTTHNVSLHFSNSSKATFQVASTAEELIKEKKVDAIIGMHSWPEAALVADVANQAQVPVLSFAAPAVTSPLTSLRWPFLIRMATNGSAQIKCIADIVRACNWRKVIAIYEEDAYDGDSGMLSLLDKALQNIDAEIENSLVLPPFSSLSDPKGFLHKEMEKLRNTTKSRVFIVLQSSLSMASHLFREAKNMGLVGVESAWIIPDSITSLLDFVDNSVISSMEGTLGIKSYYSDNSSPYKDFEAQFQKKFRDNYPEEDKYSKPGIYALRAYDSIRVIAQAIERMTSNSRSLIDSILETNFIGLSGKICFKTGELSNAPKLRIVNVVGTSVKELDFWTPEIGFSKSLDIENGQEENRGGDAGKAFTDLVIWPGNPKRVPKGWEIMPTVAKPLIIGVPKNANFKSFVEVINKTSNNSNDQNEYKGFCIELFYEVLKHLNLTDLTFPYEFVPHNGSYEELIECVFNKTYDAVVGDVTILANRLEKVEFTQPYTDQSGLTLVVPATRESPLLFLKPFTWKLWLVTVAILIYTMFVVWFLEHPFNDEFHGSWKDQICITLWFTFCSLFFAHKEKICKNHTRMVLLVWLFVVFVLSSTYTANLSSMLTVQRQQPNIDRDWLKKNNLTVGNDGGTFVRKYLEQVLHFNPDQIKDVGGEDNYPLEFESKNISAAFLELPYASVFLNKYCKYTSLTERIRFGGFGFVFQKGSPLTRNFSEAILTLSENGVITSLENRLLTSSHKCSANVDSNGTGSLSIQSFWILYLISFATSAFCFARAVFHLVKRYRRYREAQVENITGRSEVAGLLDFYHREVELTSIQTSRESSHSPGV